MWGAEGGVVVSTLPGNVPTEGDPTVDFFLWCHMKDKKLRPPSSTPSRIRIMD